MRSLLLVLALVIVSLSGCGGGGNDGCDEFGFRSAGVFTASVDGEAVRLDCYNAFVENGLTYITGYELGGDAFDFGSTITVVIGGTAPGAYEINGDDPDDVSTAQYSFGNSSASRAESGEIQLATSSTARLRGTFNFVTGSGVRVSNGAFDLDVTGLL